MEAAPVEKKPEQIVIKQKDTEQLKFKITNNIQAFHITNLDAQLTTLSEQLEKKQTVVDELIQEKT